MLPDGGVALFGGAVALGVVHGVEPGHGWPIAASYALDRSNKWLAGLAASVLLGVGHLVSSIAMVLAFFWAQSFFGLGEATWMNYVAGVLLVALGVYEYRHGHTHSHGHDDDAHDHDHSRAHGGSGDGGDNPGSPGKFGHAHVDQRGHGDGGDGGHAHGHHDHHTHDHHGGGHSHDHDEGGDGWLDHLKTALPFVGGHAHASPDDAVDRGLWGIAGFAFVLGFAHEEEFEIIALCAGSAFCLELMLVYAVTVVVGIVALTLLLIAGYQHYEERVERYAEHFPTVSAVILVLMGFGFLFGLF